MPFDYARPLTTDTVADPFVFAGTAGLLWMCGTSNEEACTFPFWRADATGQFVPAYRGGQRLCVFSEHERPAWIHATEPDRWAPEIHRVNGTWLCVYSARHRDGDLCVAVAAASHVEGPWTDWGPLLRRPNGVIDATITRDPKTHEWLLIYKGDDNSVDLPTPILTRPFRVEDQGIVWRGPEHEILRSGDDDGGLVEGPCVIHTPGQSYLIVSSHYFGDATYRTWIYRVDDFQTGRAFDRRLLLATGSPCLGSDWVGPGHACAIEEDGGTHRLYFHAWRRGSEGLVFANRFIPGTDRRIPLSATLVLDASGAPALLEELAQVSAA